MQDSTANLQRLWYDIAMKGDELHVHRLRSDRRVALIAPEDLTAQEAERLVIWLKALVRN